MDSRSSAGPKRAKNESDWTCPKCGNNNYSFRTACNRSSCGAPKPEELTQAQGGRYHHGSSNVPPFPSAYGAPMPAAAPSGGPYNYGIPSSYNVPGSSLGAYTLAGALGRENYEVITNVSNLVAGMGYGTTPYGYGPSGYGYGGGYRSAMNGYGLGVGMPQPPQMAVGRPGFYQEENGVRKRRGGPDSPPSDGDWICRKCGNVNFSFRTTCNLRKCGASKPEEPAPTPIAPSKKSSDEQPPAGSWKCDKCDNVNYPFRTKCNRKNCGADRPSDTKVGSSPKASE